MSTPHALPGDRTAGLVAPPRPGFFARSLMGLVRLYQILLSPFLGGRCRFEPSCSRYAMACLEMHGAARGSLLSVIRVCKCHPLHPGGFDPPPPLETLAVPLPEKHTPDDKGAS